MTFRAPALLLVVLAASLVGGLAHGQTADPLPAPLVTAAWLSEHLDDPGLVVLDCTVEVMPDGEGGMRQESGRAGYEQGHIPTAGFADLTGALCDADSPLSCALPTPAAFCAAMGDLGVGDDSRVVLYDRTFSVWAARVWWMLRWVGFDRAAVLDGGLRAWTAADLPLAQEAAARPARRLTPAPRPRLIADRDEVFAALGDETVQLIDAMPAPHYAGKMVFYDRPGHIPGAVNVPATAMLDADGRFLPPERLAALFGGDRDGRTITYCGSGIAASATAFVLHRLGYRDVSVYTASLQEWAADPANPLVVEER